MVLFNKRPNSMASLSEIFDCVLGPSRADSVSVFASGWMEAVLALVGGWRKTVSFRINGMLKRLKVWQLCLERGVIMPFFTCIRDRGRPVGGPTQSTGTIETDAAGKSARSYVLASCNV